MEKPTTAHCDQCGWHGPLTQLEDGKSALDECCPSCGSSDTWWGEPDDMDD